MELNLNRKSLKENQNVENNSFRKVQNFHQKVEALNSDADAWFSRSCGKKYGSGSPRRSEGEESNVEVVEAPFSSRHALQDWGKK